MNFNFAKKISPCLALLVLLASGCGKHSPAENTTPAPPVAAVDAAGNMTQPPARQSRNVAPVTVPEADASAMLTRLTEVVRRYSVEHRRVPQSLDEVVAAKYLTGLPAAPAGKKFVIDKKTLQVSLASN